VPIRGTVSALVDNTDPEARLYKKSPGTGAVLCFMGHALMENRCGLIVQGALTQVDGHAERRAALDMIHRHSPGSTRRLTLGADKGYDAAGFVAEAECSASQSTSGANPGGSSAAGRTSLPSFARRRHSGRRFGRIP
jgi:hypothetical protein